MLTDEKIRRYFELRCEVKALGRGHLQRIKEKVRRARHAHPHPHSARRKETSMKRA
jgi:hypothetical protein